MAKKQKDDEEILKSIIDKSTNITAIATAKLELSALQERKAAISAAIKPVLDVPQIIAQPTSEVASEALAGQPRKKGKAQKDDDVVTNIRKMREDIGKLSKDSAESKKLLESILETNQKYYENNNELINRLLIANGLLADKISAATKPTGVGVGGAAGGNGTVTPQEPDAGGGGLFGGLKWLFGGVGALKGLNALRKPPAVDVPKINAPDTPKLSARKKILELLKKGGKAALIIKGFLAAGLAAEWILAFFSSNEETQARMIEDALGYVPDWLEDWVSDNPDLAVMLGLQVPELAINAARAAKPITTVAKGTTEAFKGYTQLYRNFGVKPLAEGTKGVSQAAKSIWDTAKIGPAVVDTTDELRSASKIKTGLKTAKQFAVVTKETIGKAVTKAISDDAAKIGAKGIPVVGLGLAGLMAGLRAWQGDMYGAGLELLGGAVSLVPGVGTAASVAINAKLMADDLYEHFYGIRPNKETDEALRSKRWNEIYDTTLEYINEQTSKAMSMMSTDTPVSDIGASDNFAAAIAEETGGQVSVDSSVPIVGRGQYLEQQKQQTMPTVSPPAPVQTPNISVIPVAPVQTPRSSVVQPVPTQKITEEQINTIGNGSSTGQNNIVVRQGDTINNVTNNNTAGGGAAGGVSGSPSKIPSPFDYLLYGDVFNWGN